MTSAEKRKNLARTLTEVATHSDVVIELLCGRSPMQTVDRLRQLSHGSDSSQLLLIKLIAALDGLKSTLPAIKIFVLEHTP